MPGRAGLETSHDKGPWFYATIGETLTPPGRELLERYSNIPPTVVESHIYRVREIAWEIFPWPCVGQFWFVNFALSQHPQYAALVTRLTTPNYQTSVSPTLLDLGTCLGQDLRRLAFDGVRISQLYGSDLFSDFEQAGKVLFCDKNRFTGRFIAGDIFTEDANNSMGGLVRTEGTWDVISAQMFLHIWDYRKQVLACKRILKLLKRGTGSLLIGSSAGSMTPGEHTFKLPLVPEETTVFHHSKETFQHMWNVIAEETGTRMKVECAYDDDDQRGARSEEKFYKGQEHLFKAEDQKRGSGQKRFYFTVELL